jgi:hypothetical protein
MASAPAPAPAAADASARSRAAAWLHARSGLRGLTRNSIMMPQGDGAAARHGGESDAVVALTQLSLAATTMVGSQLRDAAQVAAAVAALSATSAPHDPVAAYTPLVWRQDRDVRLLRRHVPSAFRQLCDVAVALLFGVVEPDDARVRAELQTRLPASLAPAAGAAATDAGAGAGARGADGGVRRASGDGTAATGPGAAAVEGLPRGQRGWQRPARRQQAAALLEECATLVPDAAVASLLQWVHSQPASPRPAAPDAGNASAVGGAAGSATGTALGSDEPDHRTLIVGAVSFSVADAGAPL